MIPDVTTRIQVLPRVDAINVIRHDPEVSNVLSISDPDAKPPFCVRHVRGRKLVLLMDDVSTPGPNSPNSHQVNRVIAFARELGPNAKGLTVVHCNMGMSRSPACAVVMAACWFGPGHEVEAARYAARACRDAAPNSLIVELGDSLLGSDGALVAACRVEFPWC
jgi:predicted protein tyrosine phosphatase